MPQIRIKKWAAIGGASVAFYSLVTSTALALFLPRVTLQYMSFETARLDLQVSGHQVDQPEESSYGQIAQFPGADTLLPGGPTAKEDFWIRNTSTHSQPLILSGKFSVGNQDWNILKHLVQARLRVYNTNEETPWLSLEEWSAQVRDFPGSKLGDGSRRRYEFEYRILESYPTDPDGAGPLQANSVVGQEVSGKKTGTISFTVDGRLQ